MERLTKRVGVGEAVPICDFDICEPFVKCGYCKTGMQSGFPRRYERHCNDACVLGMMIDRLAYYEDMEEQGRLFIKPFKEGETAYYADEDAGRVLMGYVASYEILDDGSVYVEFTNVESDIEWVSVLLTLAEAEKTVFLTREKAENALAADTNVGSKVGGASDGQNGSD